MEHIIKNAPELRVVHTDSFLSEDEVERILRRYSGAKYVGELCPTSKNKSPVNQSMAVFWQPQAHPRGSNYFGLYYDYVLGCTMITDGLPSTQNNITGVYVPERNAIVYSAYRHDYQVYGDVFIDGGRDYTRTQLGARIAELRIVEGEWELIK